MASNASVCFSHAPDATPLGIGWALFWAVVGYAMDEGVWFSVTLLLTLAAFGLVWFALGLFLGYCWALRRCCCRRCCRHRWKTLDAMLDHFDLHTEYNMVMELEEHGTVQLSDDEEDRRRGPVPPLLAPPPGTRMDPDYPRSKDSVIGSFTPRTLARKEAAARAAALPPQGAQ
jgi:hypothetical protein